MHKNLHKEEQVMEGIPRLFIIVGSILIMISIFILVKTQLQSVPVLFKIIASFYLAFILAYYYPKL